jgi:pantoate--beta-alanine ligase
VEDLEICMRDSVALDPAVRLDYARVLDAVTLEEIARVDKSRPESAVALIAARVGGTRLIDNVLLPPTSETLIRS